MLGAQGGEGGPAGGLGVPAEPPAGVVAEPDGMALVPTLPPCQLPPTLCFCGA